MKKFIFIASMLVLASCKDFPTLSVNTSNEMTIDVNKTGTQYSGTKLLDPTTDATFNKYLKKLSDINISRVTYTISNFDGPNTQIANATFDIADSNGGNKVNLGSFSNINLASIEDKETDLVYDSNAASKLENFLIQAPNKVTVYYNGTVNQAPVKFTLKLKFYSKIKTRLIGSN
jgi:hypothetical protein